ncbi:MAG: flavodoxin-dependent (E)-4-hydroxy-3-methylbut-2-enyl-diphosphate synthase [Spirochaetia bacterium]|jgi:(E)-4-hydroxy-3-methylbut-2-enyl-diphosphate synthase|nr:flavodoxin-dependent (E)-4-hydroxy-3-methylbut-2-enyl-diphosphate synthase [Spirochaetia bacterium]
MQTKTVLVGSLPVGGNSPLSIQSMWKKPLSGLTEELVAEVGGLASLGCDILRFAVPDMGSAEVLGGLARRVAIPLVADIHFDHKLALRCMDFPIAKIRINPGNIGARWKVEEVVRKALDKNIPIRVGVNHGSLPKHLADEADSAAAMVKAAEEEIEVLESLGFGNIVISLKSSDTESTVAANRLFARRFAYPLHIGVTEAGPLIPGVVRSTLAFSSLLAEGIGNTLRVSLSDTSEAEVLTAREILSALGLRKKGIRLVSCPRCGRAGFDVHGFLAKTQRRLMALDKNLTVAVMGCVVNGPGEARHADLGITGAGNKAMIFRRGQMVRSLPEEEAIEFFFAELDGM